MNLPRGRAPWIVVTIARDRTNRRAYVFRVVVVLVVPEQVTGHSNLLRGVSGRFVGNVRSPKESGQLLDPNAVAKDGVLRPRRDLHDNGRWIAGLRRMVGRLVKHLEMPVMEIDAAAVGRLAWARVSEDEITGQRNQRRFQNLQPPLLIRAQIFSAFAFCLGVKIG